jgi:hypothetical protein
MDNSSSGPIYGQPLPKQSLPIGGNMFQALPTSQDLQSILNSKLPCRMRVVGGYEVMAGHLNALKIENEKLRQAAIAARNTEPKNELGTLHLENCCRCEMGSSMIETPHAN